ncbi:MAG: fasciclin domain-containing protein [Bacteroidota bacterium]
MTFRTILRLALLLVVAGTLSACDDSSQNIGWEPGEDLAIIGPAEEVAVPGTYEYYVQAFTIEKNYTWDVEGPVEPDYDVRREGEFVDVTYEEAGTYTININDGEEYDGSLEVSAVLVDIVTQAERLYPSLEAAIDEADLAETLGESSDITVFAPSEDAFEAVLADLEELPAPGVLADILTYHVLAAEVPSGDISDGAEVGTLYGETYPLSFSIDGDAVSVDGAANDATVTATDIPVANDVALHEIDTVLLPPTASVDMSDQAVVVEDDVTTATVDGVYVPEDGGFAAIEDADGNILGVSEDIEGGIVNEVTVELDSAVEDETDVSVVMYADADTPYERDDEPVSDDATLTPAE